MKTLQHFRFGKFPIGAILVIVMGYTLTACHENAINDLSPADSPVYITNYDRSVNFGQYKTFSLPDSVIIQSNNSYTTVKNSVSDQFVSDVAAGLTTKGFQRVVKGDSADLGVAIIRVNNRYTGVATDPYAYYSNYWGFGGMGGWGGFYPYYPTYYTYQVTEQYWEIQIVDLKNATTNASGQQQLNVLYDATIRGADVENTQDVTTAVTAIFNQSPYLETTR